MSAWWFWAMVWAGAACGVLSAAGTNELSIEEQREARKFYVVKCAKCHRFYEPKDYSEPVWNRWLNSMSEESRLKPEQRELLRRYLDDYRGGRVEGKPEDRR